MRLAPERVLKQIGYLDIVGHSHMAEGGASNPDYGVSHKMDGFLQPAIFDSCALGGAVLCWHNQGNGAQGDGGWAHVATEMDRQDQVIGRGASTLTAGTATSATSIPVASRSNFMPGDFIIIGAGTTAEKVRISTSYVQTTGAGNLTLESGCVNAHSSGDPIYYAMSNRGWLPKSQLVNVGFGANDIPVLGPVAFGTFGTTPGASRGLVPFQHALRFTLALLRCAVIYQNTHPIHVYSGFSANATTSTASYPATYFFGGNNGNYHTATTNGSTVTITTPPDFDGGTMDLFFSTGASNGAGALWNIGVTGATTLTLNSAIDTRNIQGVNQNDGASLTTGKVVGSVYRITGLNAGINVVTLTAATIQTSALYLGCGFEAPTPPLIYCFLDPRTVRMSAWQGNPYTTRAPRDATTFLSTQTATVTGGSANVTLGTAITVGTTGTASTAVYQNDTITIGTGSSQETRKISSITDTTHVVADAAFTNTHTGEACTIGLQNADITGGGYANPADTQGQTSVPGLHASIRSVVAEFDEWVDTVNVDEALNPPSSGDRSVIDTRNFTADYVHYSDRGHAQVAALFAERLTRKLWSVRQIAQATPSQRRSWVGVYGDTGATPTTGQVQVFANSWTNVFPSDNTYPRTAFYKDMRTREVFIRVACYGGNEDQPIFGGGGFGMPYGYAPDLYYRAIIPGEGPVGPAILTIYGLQNSAFGMITSGYGGPGSATSPYVFFGSYMAGI